MKRTTVFAWFAGSIIFYVIIRRYAPAMAAHPDTAQVAYLLAALAKIGWLAFIFIAVPRRLSAMGYSRWWTLVVLLPVINMVFLGWIMVSKGRVAENERV